MHGFKSFAEPVTIEFDRGITGIVGPNGSGKSNISDAIRWVLGEQSPKMLRGGKMEEVIFSGTSSRKSRGMAEVTLVIDNEDESLPIDYKEVAITRRMFRSGESEYHINGNQCRLRDIRELIMDTGIGVDGYSIIGQGKISEILSNKTESRREIFEEAAGIVMYRTKKAESERKLASTGANMERVRDIIGEIEGRIGTLKEDSIKAKEYLELRERYRELEINIILKNIESLELKNEYIKDDLAESRFLIDTTKEEKTQLETALEEYNQKRETLESISVETRESLLQTIEQWNALVNCGQISRERLAAIEDNEHRLQGELQQMEEKLLREQENERRFAEQTEKLDENMMAARSQLEEALSGYQIMSDELAGLMEKADRHKSDIFELSGTVNRGKAEINSLEMLQETLDRRKQTLLAERDSGEDNNRETLDRLNEMKREIQELEETLGEMQRQADQQRTELQTKQKLERDLSREVEELRIKLGQLSSRKKTIEEMESNYEGYNYAVRFIMKSGLRGIHGVVADLITVPGGYETALETALGAALQNVVCEDDDSAKQAIRALKEKRAGRMTFLPLSSVRGRSNRDGRLERQDGFIGFGPDCISFDEKYRGIIEYLLGRVVLVDHMDHAVRMSKFASGVRFVTLDGEVINASGAITGGKYKNKTANLLDRKAEITAMQQQIGEMTDQKEDKKKKLYHLRDELEQLTEHISEMGMQIRMQEQELTAKKHDAVHVESVLRDLKTSGDKLAKELEHIDAEKEHSRQMIAALQQEIERGIAAIRMAELDSEACMEEYNRRKTEFDAVSEEITAKRIAVNGCEREKQHAEEMAERIADSIHELTSELDTKKLQLSELQKERVRLTDGSDDADVRIREMEAEKQRLEEYLEEVTEEKADTARTISRCTEEKNALDQKLERAQNQKYELEIKNAKNETQLDTYKNKLWEDLEVSYIQAMEFKSEDFVMADAVKENKQIKARIKALGEVNVGAIEEYEVVRERYEFLTGQQADIQEAMDQLTGIIAEMDQTIRDRFKESFDRIVINFEHKFRELFGGGHAELRLSDEKNPLESNIDIVAQPPGKKLQNINLLSGGEKTLTAIALMFAVLETKPTPFCILDEVEAALDDANIDRFIQCLRTLPGIQFALVTHQKATMEHADALYGVTMPEKGVSKVLSLNMNSEF